MKRALFFVCTALGLLAAAVPTASAADRKPNVLVIVADDLGYADIGANGCKDIPTPNIDSIASGGVRFTSGYVSGPYCSPTRAGLMTGRYQTRFGHEFNPGPAENAVEEFGLPLSETAFPKRMKDSGYATGMVGKWHLGYESQFHPQARGFDEFFGFLGGAHSYLDNEDPANKIMRGNTPVTEVTYLTDMFGDEAVKFVDSHKDHPWFLYLAFNAVHTPMHTADKYLARFPDIKDTKRQHLAAMHSAMDDIIGRVLETTRKNNQENDTLIFFVADNGGPTESNGSRNTPLSGYKAQTWEGGIRVPFLIQWKGTIPSGQVYDQPCIQLDFLPTALAAAGVEAKPEWKFDGVNLLPYLKGEKKEVPHKALFWRFGAQIAIRMGDWKLVQAPPRDGTRRTETQGKATTEGADLYNLANDISEEKDLASTETAKFEELATAWNEWNKELVPAKWFPDRTCGAKKNAAKGKGAGKKARAK